MKLDAEEMDVSSYKQDWGSLPKDKFPEDTKPIQVAGKLHFIFIV